MSNIIQYKCPSCGAVLTFDSTTQKMKCPYCDTEFNVDSSTVINQSNTDYNTFNDNESENLGIYHCDSCGAEVIADSTTAATNCPYCENAIILKGRLSGELKPDLIIPFKYDKEAAKQALGDHLRGKKLLPKVFSSENHLDEIKGVYIPFWIYDTDVIADVNYSATNLRTWSDTRYQYTETSYYDVKRKGRLSFESLPVDALSSLPNEMTESLEIFDSKKAVPFNTAYLSGFFANKYDVSKEECAIRAKDRINKSCLNELASTVRNYSSVSTQSSSIQLQNTRASYGLYPVWLLNTTWRGNKYTFAMNGESGKFVGNLPIDKGIYWRYRLLYGGGIAAALFAVAYFLFGGIL